MAQTGWQFAADLSELRTVGAVDLPAMAYTFAALDNLVAGTSAHDGAAFAREGAGGLDLVHPDWSALRDLLQNVLGVTSANMERAADVLLRVVDAYAATDEEARRSLETAWRDGPPMLHDGENPPPGPPPPLVIK
jgi:hypothetical protein